MRRTVPLVAGFLSGALLIVAYFWSTPALKKTSDTLVSWRNIVVAFSLGIGAVNLVQSNARKVMRRTKGWDASILLLASLAVFAVAGLYKGTSSPVYKWGFENIYQPIYSGIASLLAFMITSASYRAFKAKDFQAVLLMLSAVIVMLGQVGVGLIIYKGLPVWSQWIMSVVNMAGMRGITIGGALGAIALSLRVLLGLERGYLGGDRT